MVARIYRPSKNVMQSGKAKEKIWLLSFNQLYAKLIEPLMGYTSSCDMNQQILLRFKTKEQAIIFAEKNGLSYYVEEPKKPKRAVLSYADNFSPTRAEPWTH